MGEMLIMAKLSELVSNVKVSNDKTGLGSKITREVNAANRPVKVETFTKAEAKEIEKRFAENNKAARERELAFQRKRQSQALEKRKQREAEKKAAMQAK